MVAAWGLGCDKAAVVAPSSSTLTLAVADTVVRAGGSTTVTARAIEPAGTAVHDGTVVTFSATLGEIYPDEAPTVRGRATATFTAGRGSGVASIRAYSGDAISEPVDVTVGAAAVEAVRLTAQPGALPPDGGTARLEALVLDAAHSPVPGVEVTFSATAGRLRPSGVTTGDGGTAAATLTTTTTTDITAAAGGAEATVTVTVDLATAITITPTPAVPVAGQAVRFAVTLENAVRAVESAEISFGDGASAPLGAAATATAVHTYREPGAYTVTVTARDTAGHTSTASIVIQVDAAPAVAVRVSAAPAAPTAGSPVTFTVEVQRLASAPAVRGVAIDFGDGSRKRSLGALSGSATVAHVYERAGTYRVVVTVEDALGRESESSVALEVRPAPSIPARISVSPAAPVAGSPMTFTVEVVPPVGAAAVRAVTVDFGDGSRKRSLGALSGSATVAHVYERAGAYRVVVTVEDAAGRRSESSVALEVRPAPSIPARISVSPAVPVAGNAATFTVEVLPPAGAAPVRAVTMDFGDGSEQQSLGVLTGSGTVAHVYEQAGNYIVTVTVEDATGARSDSSVGITVAEAPEG